MAARDPLEILAKEGRVLSPPPAVKAMSREALDEILIWAARTGVSDIHLQTEEPITFELDSHYYVFDERALSVAEMQEVAAITYGSNATAQLGRAVDLDPSYTVRAADRTFRFRINLTACDSFGADGIQMTIRVLNGTPRSLKDMNVEEDLVPHLRPRDGLVVVAGATGSGKTTLLGGVIVDTLNDPAAHKKIITYEAPIELVYWHIPRSNSLITQHEIPRHLPSFGAAVRNAMRRAPKVILVGETRDPETGNACLEAARTGHLVYTTVHADSVHRAILRLTGLFSPTERPSKLFEIIDVLRVMVIQQLVPREDAPGRVPLREFLVFDDDMRDRLRVSEDIKHVVTQVKAMVESRGQTMLRAAYREHEAGRIHKRVVAELETKQRVSAPDDYQPVF